ncbi:hypothetical protein Q3G72_010312 [Acer saccharum]|nr:hypothetical protein Q3G72_010312 [Acer saccharum]
MEWYGLNRREFCSGERGWRKAGRTMASRKWAGRRKDGRETGSWRNGLFVTITESRVESEGVLYWWERLEEGRSDNGQSKMGRSEEGRSAEGRLNEWTARCHNEIKRELLVVIALF